MDIRDRIRKLLALAENDGAAAGEIENALRFADRLMAEHNLTRAQVIEADGHARAAELERMDRVSIHANGAKHSTWEGQLARYVCELIGGVYVYSDSPAPVYAAPGICRFDANGRRVIGARYCFYGDAEGIQVAADTFRELSTLIAAMARLRYGSVMKGDGAVYALGFVCGLQDQMREGRQKERAGTAQPAQPGAIVLSSSQRNALDKWHTENASKAKNWLASAHGIHLRTTSRSAGYSGDGNAGAAGRADGRAANVRSGRAPKLSGGFARSLPGR